MLKGIPSNISPDLLKALCEMGHGDELVIADSNFPSHSINSKVIHMDGVNGTDTLISILKLIPLDTYSEENFILMQVVENDPIPSTWEDYINTAKKLDDNVRVERISRFDFYDRAKKAYLVIATGETRVYGNIILKKGVIK